MSESIKELRQERRITAAQAARAQAATHPRVTSDGELWVTKNGRRLLIDKKGEVVITGGKVTENW